MFRSLPIAARGCVQRSVRCCCAAIAHRVRLATCRALSVRKGARLAPEGMDVMDHVRKSFR